MKVLSETEPDAGQLRKIREAGLRCNPILHRSPWQSEGEVFVARTSQVMIRVRFPNNTPPHLLKQQLETLRVMLEVKYGYEPKEGA